MCIFKEFVATDVNPTDASKCVCVCMCVCVHASVGSSCPRHQICYHSFSLPTITSRASLGTATMSISPRCSHVNSLPYLTEFSNWHGN